MLKIDNDAWKERLMKESWKKLEQVEAKYKSKIERMETSYLSQLNEADEEAKKREELFLTSMSSKRKPDASRRSKESVECNSDGVKSNLEVHDYAITHFIEISNLQGEGTVSFEI